ncbi:MAG: agmatine deiminase family protein [Candidatus Eisenbacteria bacterium]|jgi:agmatine deiminase|nr:agmatine deiminase family protein [Candidatus Eisenbacteria bacterium]
MILRGRSVFLAFALGLTVFSWAFAQPPYDLRPLAEFEPQSAVIIGWYDLGLYGPQADTMWARAVDAVQDVALAVIGVAAQNGIAPIQGFLTSMGIPLDNVEFYATSTLSGVWVRDYGPEFVYRENGWRVVVEGGYWPSFPQFVADELGVEHYHAPISMQGGNYMTDGATEVAVSGRYVSNPEFWQQTIRSYFDLPLHIVPYLVGEGCGHIDMYARFVAPSRVVISQYVDPTHNSNMDLAAAEFEQRGFEVFRVMTPPVVAADAAGATMDNRSLLHLPPGVDLPEDGVRGVYRTYTNGIQCNGVYLLPVYSHEYDAQAAAVFQAALPDHKIVPINCNRIIQFGGALHCTSSDVQITGLPRPEPLQVCASDEGAELSWPPVMGAALYDIFRRTVVFGYDLHLDDAVCSTASTVWVDEGGAGSPGTICYQVVAVMANGVRSMMSSRSGRSLFDLDHTARR